MIMTCMREPERHGLGLGKWKGPGNPRGRREKSLGRTQPGTGAGREGKGGAPWGAQEKGLNA